MLWYLVTSMEKFQSLHNRWVLRSLLISIIDLCEPVSTQAVINVSSSRNHINLFDGLTLLLDDVIPNCYNVFEKSYSLQFVEDISKIN